VELRLLGAVELELDGAVVTLGPPQQRLVVAVLAVEAGRPVAAEALIDRVWDEAQAGSRRTLHMLMSRLRGLLRPAGLDVVRRSGGYVLDVDPALVDLHRFRRLVREARAGDAADRLATALGLWRGEPLAGLPGRWAAQMRAAWRQEHLDATVAWAHVQLQKGDPTAVVGPLTALADEQPLAESLTAVLMRALAAAGRPADALERYTKLRLRLADELGTDPAPEVQAVHRDILRTASVLRAAQLPADVAGFAGRAEHLARLDALLEAGATAAVVSGTAGVGKTTLAVHWAHSVADRFPDGQLYVNLRGFDPSGRVMDPAEALRGFLEALGVAPERMPLDVDGRAALYRSLLLGQRMLIVLDNARDAAQARPLLPGTPTALTLLTSRDQLMPLIAANGAHPVTLDVMSADEGRDLLARRLGAPRVDPEAAASARIIAACAGLPLALTIAAARAVQTGFALAALAEELATATGRLDVLDAGDPATEVRAVFSWSYTALRPEAAALFRYLGLAPGAYISVGVAASLADLPPARARRLLAELTRANLLTEASAGRYTFHDLLRAYATDLVHATDPPERRRAALARLFDYYVHSAHAADRTITKTRDAILLPLAPPAPGVIPETPVDYRAAMDWLDAEHPGAVGLVRDTTDPAFDTPVWQLTWAYFTFLHRQGHWQPLTVMARRALAAADRLGDPGAQATAHYVLGFAETMLGRHKSADGHFAKAITLYGAAGDLVGQANTHSHLGMLLEQRGRTRQALDHAQRALLLFHDAGHQLGQAKALNALGWCHALLGGYTHALIHCGQALQLFQELGDRETEAAAWDSLGYAHHHLGHYAQAVDCYESALALVREFDDRFRQAIVLDHLGDVHASAGDHEAARRRWQDALDIYTDLRHSEAAAVRAKLT
jgi:DNA-binding SARP family transcriptional activator/tetratricopeptide (TPR) repeat protein